MSPRLVSALVLGGVFLLGAITGGGVVRFAGGGRHGLGGAGDDGAPLLMRQRVFVNALDREVRLDRSQREQVRGIVAAHDREIREIRRTIKPRTGKLRRQTLEEVRGLMRRDQLSDFQRFVEQQEARARSSDDGPNSP